MRVLLRLALDAGDPIPLCVDLAEDATVGELADHLAALVGSAADRTIEGLHHDALVHDAGPASGSLIRLGERHYDELEAPVAPVRIVHNLREGHTSDEQLTLRYGNNDMGPVEVQVSDRIELVPRSDTRILVNGHPVIGSHHVAHGDLVAVLDTSLPDARTSWDRRSTRTAFVVEVLGRLEPPTTGPFRLHRPRARIHDEYVDRIIRAPSAPDDSRTPGLPVLSILVPLLFGAALWTVTRSAASAMFILFSFVYVAAAAVESRIEFRRDRTFREAEFRTGVRRALVSLRDSQEAERAFLDRTTPGPEGLVGVLTTDRERIWERHVEDTTGGLLSVRVGTARREAVSRVERMQTGRADLLEWFEERLAESSRVELPVTVDLDEGGGVGLVGHDESSMELARWMVLQLAVLVGPDLLRIVVVSGPDRSREWAWTAFLPHAADGSDTTRTLIVVDRADDREVLRRLEGIDPGSVRFLWLADRHADLPRLVGQVVDTTGSGSVVRARRDDGAVFEKVDLDRLSCDAMPRDVAAELATGLSPLVPERVLEPRRHDEDHAAALSDLVGATVDPFDPGSISTNWVRSATGRGLSAPLARSGSGTVEIDLVSDGPHVLIAGMTGAGKSELLRTWLLSLALFHPPERVTFLLVDYKGGSAFGPLSGLPHSVGLITDLDAQLAERAMVSLRAELRSRESWLAAVGAGSMAEAQGCVDRPPALLVVVDEFATLAKELPGLVDELVDVAQRGRSLGIHLILATQRPHGVVSESIRANTAVRIALRVADASDSNDVIDAPDAASIPSDCPGSAIIRIGQARSGTVRFAYSAAPSGPRPRVRAWRLGLDEAPIDDPYPSSSTEIELITAAIGQAFTASGAERPRRPWSAPLQAPILLDSPELLGPRPRTVPRSAITLGLKDRPEHQDVVPLRLDLDAGPGIVVFGAAGESRSMALATIAESTARTLEDPLVYAIGGRPAHVCDSIPMEARERVLRILRHALRHTNTPSRTQRMMIIIDDIAVFEKVYGTLNRGEAMEIIERLCRHSAGPTNIVVGASRRMDVPPGLMVGFVHRIVLGLNSEDDASLLGVPVALAGDLPPGRGLHDGHWVQIATGYGSKDLAATMHRPVPELPAVVPLTSIAPGPDEGTGAGPHDRAEPGDPVACVDASTGGSTGTAPPQWRIPVGLGADDLSPALLDLTHGHAVIAGPRRSGSSNALAVTADSWRRHCSPGRAARTVVIEPGSVETYGADGSAWDHRVTVPTIPGDPGGQPSVTAGLDEVVQRVQQRIPVLIALDQLPTMLEGANGEHLERFLQNLMTLAADHPVRVVAGGEIDAISRCYSPALSSIRASRTGILLRPDIDVHGSVLGTELHRRDELDDTVGRGWLVNSGEASPLQVAVRD